MGDSFHEGPQSSRGTQFEKQGNPKEQPGADSVREVPKPNGKMVGYPFEKQGNDEAHGGRPEPDAGVPKGYVRNETATAPGSVAFVNEMGSGTMNAVEQDRNPRDADDRLGTGRQKPKAY